MSAHTLITRLIAIVLLVGVAVAMVGPMVLMSPGPMSAQASLGLHPTVLADDALVDHVDEVRFNPDQGADTGINLAELSPACADGTSHCSKNCNRLDFAALVFTRATDGRLKILTRTANPPVIAVALALKNYGEFLSPPEAGINGLQIGHRQAGASFKTVFARTSRFLS